MIPHRISDVNTIFHFFKKIFPQQPGLKCKPIYFKQYTIHRAQARATAGAIPLARGIEYDMVCCMIWCKVVFNTISYKAQGMESGD